MASNAGNTRLQNVTVDVPNLPLALSESLLTCSSDLLDVGANITCTATQNLAAQGDFEKAHPAQAYTATATSAQAAAKTVASTVTVWENAGVAMQITSCNTPTGRAPGLGCWRGSHGSVQFRQQPG